MKGSAKYCNAIGIIELISFCIGLIIFVIMWIIGYLGYSPLIIIFFIIYLFVGPSIGILFLTVSSICEYIEEEKNKSNFNQTKFELPKKSFKVDQVVCLIKDFKAKDDSIVYKDTKGIITDINGDYAEIRFIVNGIVFYENVPLKMLDIIEQANK